MTLRIFIPYVVKNPLVVIVKNPLAVTIDNESARLVVSLQIFIFISVVLTHNA